MNKRILFVSTAILLLLCSMHMNAASQSMTLQQVVRRTIRTNPDVLAQTKIRKAASEAVKSARAGYLPTIDVAMSYGREETRNATTRLLGLSQGKLWRRSASVNARQNVFNGFLTHNEISRHKARTVADAYRVWGSAEDIALDTINAYADVLRNRKLLEIAKRNELAHERTYEMIRRRSEQGIGREADITQAAGRLDLARANWFAAQNRLHDAEDTFQRVTGFMPGNLRDIPAPRRKDIARNEQDAVNIAIRNHPTLKSAVADVEEAKAQHRVALSQQFPVVDLTLSGASNRNLDGAVGPNADILGLVEFRYNVFRGGADIARARETAYLSQEASEIRNRTYRQVVENMKLSWNRYLAEKSRMVPLKDHRDAAKKTVEAYRKQFRLGKRTLLDLLDSENELFNADQAYTNSFYDWVLSKYRLLNGEGRLLKFLKVKAPAASHVPYESEYVHNKQLNAYTVEPIKEYRATLPAPNHPGYDETTVLLTPSHPKIPQPEREVTKQLSMRWNGKAWTS